jgi:membrane-bound lytic murein transglycosylase B
MRLLLAFLLLSLVSLSLAAQDAAVAQPQSFDDWLAELRTEALAMGISPTKLLPVTSPCG